uniref:Uncharacterized protein n=1 Tax=Globodera rostochiensis TaxID=31243 RepID=A0A914I7I1_GLORO
MPKSIRPGGHLGLGGGLLRRTASPPTGMLTQLGGAQTTQACFWHTYYMYVLHIIAAGGDSDGIFPDGDAIHLRHNFSWE